MEELTGKQLGPYQVVAPLGEGGMAAVYKAYQPGMERYVALKILPRHFANDPQFAARFDQEAKVLAKLQHPHILPVFDYGQAEGYTYLVMPFLQSGDLTDLLTNRSLPLAQIRRFISQIGDALDYAHSHGLIHRDVKPSNVLLDERGNCLLTDFGIAKIIEGSSKLTVTGGIVGTPAYMSPEQGMGEKIDGRSDIYALGIMLYEMATGRVPYQAETPMAVMIKHLNDALPLPRRLNPALPEAVERVILKALAKQPQDRYATAGEMVRVLQAAIPETIADEKTPENEPATFLSLEPASATVKSEAVQTSAARRPAPANLLWLLAAAAAIVVVIGAVIFWAVGGNGQLGPTATLSSTSQVEASPVSPTEAIAATDIPSTSQPGSASAGLAAYDNFDDPAFDGAWNSDLWQPDSDEPCQIAQQDGVLIFTSPAQTGETVSCALMINQPDQVSADALGTVEARLQIADDLSGEQVNQGIGLSTEDLPGGDWFAFCGLAAHPDSIEAYFEVANYGAGASPDISQGLPAAFDQWYTFRLEVTPDPLTLACFVDGALIGSVTPADAPTLGQARFYRTLDSYREAGSTATTYADDVRLSGDSALYDDFENPAFEGQLNTELWEPWETIDNCQAAQEEGVLRFSCTRPDGSGLNALRYQGAAFGQVSFVEARLNLDSEMQAERGAVTLLLASSLANWAECSLYNGAEQGQAQLSCGVASDRSGTFTEEYNVAAPATTYDTWHTVRIEINPDSGEFAFFVDGQRIGAHVPAQAEALKTAQFDAELQVYLENGSLVTGYFDDVRIGRAEP
jgi:serine/threonine protein kinase